MFKRIIRNLAEEIAGNLVVGDHCGLCGAWVKDCIVPYYWRWTICEKCSKGKLDNSQEIG